MPRRPHPAFAAWLREHLDVRGWSAADLAALVGVRRPTVYHWTAGHVTPLDPQVAGIARALGVEASDVWAVLARDGVTPFGAPAMPHPDRGPVAWEPPADRPFPRWLRAQLDARGWSAGRLARRMGIDNKTANKWANGSCPPASVQRPGLAAALGVDVATIEDLLNRADSADGRPGEAKGEV